MTPTVPETYPDRAVCIVGLGYVGLTLAVAMAEAGFHVVGLERAAPVLAGIASGVAHFEETGLNPRLAAVLADGRLRVGASLGEAAASRVFIVTVGTPLGPDGRTNLDHIATAARQVAEVLKPGDMVLLRSTVRVGVSREVVKPLLDAAGFAYDLAFCPERTLEGRALAELRTLPQVVGGLDGDATSRAAALYALLTPTVVRVGSLEAAELAKLVNNTARDLQFAFASEVALICDQLNVPVTEVMQAANFGYPRSGLALPGPVGGPCLEKDPHILAESVERVGGSAPLSRLSRAVNGSVPARCAAEALGAAGPALDAGGHVAVFGLAFKGRPETSDLRGTPAKPLIAEIARLRPGVRIVGHDPLTREEEVRAELGLDLLPSGQDAAEGAAVVIFQTNSPRFANLDLGRLAGVMQAGGVIYDMWNQFTRPGPLPGGVRYFGLGARAYLAET